MSDPYECSSAQGVRQVLEASRETPGTMGTVRRADRMLAAQPHQRGLSVTVTENALVLAATRRMIRPTHVPPPGMVRSLAYFPPVIEEVLELRVSPDYFEYLHHNLARTGLTVARPTLDDTAPSARMMEQQRCTPAAWMISSPLPKTNTPAEIYRL